MQPIIFGISSYLLFLVIALFVTVIGTVLIARKRGLPQRAVVITVSAMVVATIVGARGLHILTNASIYRQDPSRMFAFDASGFSLFGGLIAAVIVGWIGSRLLRLNVWRFGDAAAPMVGVGIAVVRIGCFLNGCCFGKETNLPWGVTFPFMSFAHKYEIAQNPSRLFEAAQVHPTQIYELIAALIGAGIAWHGSRYEKNA
jgi:phosphatidylglycerol:prolipoprotein diacylglycerol transferase